MMAPDPMERMEEEWTIEGDEVSIMSFNVSVPVDVMVRRGDDKVILSVIVKESSVTV